MFRKFVLLLAILSLVLPACQPIQTPAPLPPISDQLVLSPPAATVTQYSGVELPLTTTVPAALTVTNPYDPGQIDLHVHFTAPDGQMRTVPAFWLQDFDTVTQRPTGEPGWRVRFTPHIPGEWVAQAELVGQTLQSAPISFPVAPSANPGFVHIHPANHRYFAFDDGTLYFPIGLNIGWAGADVLGDYTRWFDRLSANGGNVARIWMASWAFGIEWNKLGCLTRFFDWPRNGASTSCSPWSTTAPSAPRSTQNGRIIPTMWRMADH